MEQRKRRASDETERDRDDRQKDVDRRKRLRDQNWNEFNNENNNNRNNTFNEFDRRPFEDFDFRLQGDPSHGFANSGPIHDRYNDDEMVDEQDFEEMVQIMEERMPPRVGAMSSMEKREMMKTMMAMMSRMDPDKSRRLDRLRERRRANERPGAPPGSRPQPRPEHRPNKTLCKYFLDGKCHKGVDCPFSHDAMPPKKKELCKFYLQGFCSKGDDCLFMHGEFPCKFFHTNVECYAGPKCRFSHQPLTEETREILRNYLDSGTLPDDPKPYHRPNPPSDTDSRNNSQPQSHNQNAKTEPNSHPNSDTSAGQSSTYVPVKPVPKRHAVLGDVTQEMRTSFQTWVWQQEMKELELAYVGNKRNLFCIEKPFVMTEKPPTPRIEDDEDEIEEQIRNYYRDTMPEIAGEDVDHRIEVAQVPVVPPVVTAPPPPPIVNHEEQKLIEMSAHDEDLRTLMMPRARSHTNESMSNPIIGSNNDIDERSQTSLTSTEESQPKLDLPQNVPKVARDLYYKMQDKLLKDSDDHSDSDDDDTNLVTAALKNLNQSAQQSPSSTDRISHMLSLIRNNTNSNAPVNQSPNQSEFWQNILGVLPKPSGSPQMGSSTPPRTEYRDPRLKRGGVDSSPSLDTTPPVKICDPNAKIEYKLIPTKIPEIDYACYVSLYRIDSRLKNDPRLVKFFSKLPSTEIDNLSRIVPPPLKTAPVTPLSVLKSKKKSEKERQKSPEKKERPKAGSPTLPPLPPLTISPSKTAPNPGIFPPTPPPIMSPLELITSRPSYTVGGGDANTSKLEIKTEPIDVFAISKTDVNQRRPSTERNIGDSKPPPLIFHTRRRSSSSSASSPPKLTESAKSPTERSPVIKSEPLPSYMPSSMEAILKSSFAYSSSEATSETKPSPSLPSTPLLSTTLTLTSSSLTKDLFDSSIDSKSMDLTDLRTNRESQDKEEQMETSSNCSEDLYDNLNPFQPFAEDIKPKALTSPRSSMDELELIRTELNAPPMTMTMTSIDSSDNEMEIDLRRRADSVSEVESADECELMIASSSEPEDNNNDADVTNNYLKFPKNIPRESTLDATPVPEFKKEVEKSKVEVTEEVTKNSIESTETTPEVKTETPIQLNHTSNTLSNSCDQKPEPSDQSLANSSNDSQNIDSEPKVIPKAEIDPISAEEPMNLIVSEPTATESAAKVSVKEPEVTESCDQSLKSVFSTIDPTASPFC